MWKPAAMSIPCQSALQVNFKICEKMFILNKPLGKLNSGNLNSFRNSINVCFSSLQFPSVASMRAKYVACSPGSFHDGLLGLPEYACADALVPAGSAVCSEVYKLLFKNIL